MRVWENKQCAPGERTKEQRDDDRHAGTVPIGRIATVNQKGFPVIKPVNFLYLEGKIYLHSSTKGEKMDDMTAGKSRLFLR